MLICDQTRIILTPSQTDCRIAVSKGASNGKAKRLCSRYTSYRSLIGVPNHKLPTIRPLYILVSFQDVKVFLLLLLLFPCRSPRLLTPMTGLNLSAGQDKGSALLPARAAGVWPPAEFCNKLASFANSHLLFKYPSRRHSSFEAGQPALLASKSSGPPAGLTTYSVLAEHRRIYISMLNFSITSTTTRKVLSSPPSVKAPGIERRVFEATQATHLSVHPVPANPVLPNSHARPALHLQRPQQIVIAWVSHLLDRPCWVRSVKHGRWWVVGSSRRAQWSFVALKVNKHNLHLTLAIKPAPNPVIVIATDVESKCHFRQVGLIVR